MAPAKFKSDASLGERLHKEEAFFSQFFMMSYSGLNRLLYSPALFYNHYVLGQREDTLDKNMIEGKLIHCLLLDPENFDKEFVLASTDVPSDNPKQLLHQLYAHHKELSKDNLHSLELSGYSEMILDILRDMNLYQSLKTDAQRLEKIVNPKHESYWEYLNKAEGRVIVDDDMYNFAKSVVEKIQRNATVMEVMGFFGDSFNGVSKVNEVELTMFPEDLPFGLRGFIDNMVFDPLNKEIRINDLKKTAKDIGSFRDSIDYYRYWMQAAIYVKMVRDIYLSQPAYQDWNVTFRFVVVDPYMQIAPIRISDETMVQWVSDTEAQLQRAAYHFEKRSFELPYDFLVTRELVL